MHKFSFIKVLILLALSSFNPVLAGQYTIAVRAHHGTAAAVKQWQPTLDYLNQHLPEHHFKLLPVISLKAITESAGKGEFDFVLTNPSSYVEINQLYQAEALVTLNNKRSDTAQDRFGSVIFVSVYTDNILSLQDLHGKTLMAVSEQAFGGWRVGWRELLKQNIDPYKDLKALRFTKNSTQQEVVYAVRDGIVDAGVVRTDLLERMEAAGEIDMRYFRVLNNKDIKGFPFFLSTDLYPEWNIAALKHVPAEVKQQVTQQLLSIRSNETAAVQGKYIGWVPARDYSSVKALLAQLKVMPDEHTDH